MSSPQQCSYTTSIGLPPPVAIGDQVGRPANHRFCCACFPKEQQSAVPQEHPSQFFNRARGTKKERARVLSQAGRWGGTIGVSNPPLREAPIVSSPSIATILRDHVSLSISCVDRLYLNGYVPLLQAPGHIATFCRQQLHAPSASPALFRPLLERFTHAVNAFAEQHDVPIIHF